MNKEQTAQLMAVVKTAYPNFEITRENTRLWCLMLEDVGYKEAQENLYYHIKSNKFPPSIAEIIRLDETQGTDHHQMKLETEQRLLLLQDLDSEAISYDEYLKRKALEGGVSE